MPLLSIAENNRTDHIPRTRLIRTDTHTSSSASCANRGEPSRVCGLPPDLTNSLSLLSSRAWRLRLNGWKEQHGEEGPPGRHAQRIHSRLRVTLEPQTNPIRACPLLPRPLYWRSFYCGSASSRYTPRWPRTSTRRSSKQPARSRPKKLIKVLSHNPSKTRPS